MSYYLDLFSPSTYDAFLKSDQRVSGFRSRQNNAAVRVQPGDILICYLTKQSSWIAALRVTSPLFEDNTPCFTTVEDPFVLRFKVEPLVLLDPAQGIPIRESIIWDHLSFTKTHERNGSGWTGPLRSSLKLMSDEDGSYLLQALQNQARNPVEYPFDPTIYNKYLGQAKTSGGGVVTVSVPENPTLPTPVVPDDKEVRESIKV